MFAVKRSNPFGEDATLARCAKNTSEHSAFDRTLQTLMAAGQAQAAAPQDAPMGGGDPCHICRRHSGAAAPCFYCAQETCETCLRQCEGCREVFCSFCSTTNYDLRQDRLFCLSCNEEARRTEQRTQHVAGAAGAMMEAGGAGGAVAMES